METAAKHINVAEGSKLTLTLIPGYACSGFITVELFDKGEDKEVFIQEVNLEEGGAVINFPPLGPVVTDYVLAGYGKMTPLPGKKEVRLEIVATEGDKQLDTLEITDERFKFMLLPKTSESW